MVTLVAMDESKQVMKLSRVLVTVPAGDSGARAGLLFVTNQDTTGEELTKKLERYDGWTAEDYNKFKKEKYVYYRECFDVGGKYVWNALMFG